MEQKDDELVRAYYEGNPDAFNTLFVRHKDKVFSFALRLLSNRAEAEDVTSDVFIQLFHKRFVQDGRAQVGTWLLTITRNASISRMRSVKHAVSFWFKGEDDTDQAWDIADTSPSQAQNLLAKERSTALQKAINKLPVEQKEALILREYMDKNYGEIAQILGCSLDKVKILIFRARERLREDMQDFLSEGGS